MNKEFLKNNWKYLLVLLLIFVPLFQHLGSLTGISPYYEITPGNHNVLYYDSYPGYEGWHKEFTYNFQIGRKYTIVCDYKDEEKFLLKFYVTDDGLISKSDIAVKSSSSTKNDKSQNSKTRTSNTK